MSKIAPDVLPPQSLCDIFERMLAVEVFGREHSRIHAGNFQTGVSQDENAVLWPSVSFSIQGFIEDLPFEYPRMNILIAPQGNCKPAFECLRNPLAETMAGKIDVILDAFGYTRQSVLQAEKFERLCEVPEKLLNALYLYCENGEEPQPVTEAERNLWEETLAAVRRRFGNKRCVANFGLPGSYNPEFGTMYTVSVVPEYEFDDLPDRLPEPFEQKQGLTGFQMRVIDAFFAQAKGVEEQQSVLTEHTDRLPKALRSAALEIMKKYHRNSFSKGLNR